MNLYRTEHPILIKDSKRLHFYIKTMKKTRRSQKLLLGFGALCFSSAFALTIGLCVSDKGNETVPMQIEQNLSFPSVLKNMDISLLLQDKDDNIYENESQLEQYFSRYCAIYQVNKDLVYQKALELTNGFMSDEWLVNHNIGGTRALSKERSCETEELGVLLFVRHIKQIPNDFGFTEEELATNQTYQLDCTYEDFTEQQCTLFPKLDSMLCQAIQYHETGYYRSDVFLNNNNVAGIIDGDGEYKQFRNVAESILELIIQLNYKYLEDAEISQCKSVEEQIAKIQPIFCPLKDEKDKRNLNQNWLSGVTAIYQTLVSEKRLSSNTK